MSDPRCNDADAYGQFMPRFATAFKRQYDSAPNEAFLFRSADVTTDGRGTWVAVWRSTDPLCGTIGASFDSPTSTTELESTLRLRLERSRKQIRRAIHSTKRGSA